MKEFLVMTSHLLSTWSTGKCVIPEIHGHTNTIYIYTNKKNMWVKTMEQAKTSRPGFQNHVLHSLNFSPSGSWINSLRTKIQLYISIVKSVLLDGLECWCIIESDIKKVEVCHSLHKINKILWPNTWQEKKRQTMINMKEDNNIRAGGNGFFYGPGSVHYKVQREIVDALCPIGDEEDIVSNKYNMQILNFQNIFDWR